MLTGYTVKQLSKLSGVSIRTLHHYDEIDLLKPAGRSEKGYRLYNYTDLFRLQQILFYKELRFSLEEIKNILNDPEFNIRDSLIKQKKMLIMEKSRIASLLITLDKTIKIFSNNGETIMDEKEIYAGFSDEQIKEYRREVAERWGSEKLNETENNLKKMPKDKFESVKREGEEIAGALGELIGKDASSAEVQKLIYMHYKNLQNYYTVTREIYNGLADLYVQDERFRAYYENIKPGLAEFISQGMKIFCKDGKLS